MTSDASALEYATPTRRRWRLFHAFALPLLWLPAGIGSRIHYGDEFVPFAVAHMPAWPLANFIESRFETETLFRIVIAFNFLLMILTGLLMNLVRVPRWSYLALPPLLLAAVLSRWFVFETIPPRQAPWSPNVEWEPVFLFPAWAWATYTFAMVSLAITSVVRVILRIARRAR